ncbi:MAG: hemerythrin family protein [Desulfobacterales bacterium]|nr:hemerythrin family protein [Desulfobacterales bacterium]MCP4162887.1 hemerythrin family protein [Deltaproteobacteria bacterium]
MAFINWNDSLSVGVEKFDKEHKVLVGIINDLSDAMKQGKGKEVIGKTLDGLIDYTMNHFKNEEMYFKKFNYPDKADHIKEHLSFVEKVSEFKEGFETGKLSLSIEVMNFLKDWLQKHINTTDKKYTAFFNEKGLN